MRKTKKRLYRKKSRFRIFWMVTQITFLFIIISLLVAAGAIYFSVSKMIPQGADLANYKPIESTKIYSSDGVLLAEIFKENREFISYDTVPKHLKDATVAIEDFRFYNHPGVDIVGIARAFYRNLQSKTIGQGGSTLTQQLVRNIYLTPEKTFTRKLQEIALAIQLERQKTKDEILEMYLNEVYYGSGTFGVQTAAKIYFGKDAKDLTLAESALIAGLPKKPSGYSPYENLKAAIGRRNIVLGRMAELGYITNEEKNEAVKEEVKLVGLKRGGISKYKAPWFVTHVIKSFNDEHDDLIYTGGLRIYTTLNYEMQQVAEKALREGVKRARYQRVSQGALVCIDPKTGHIKAMVGGVNPNFVADQFNRVTQAKRQPGSTFKAFVYTAAIDNGYSADYRISNNRISYPMGGGKSWTPRNDNGRYGGTYTIKNAVAQSVNVCAVRMADMVGIDEVIKYAHMLGIKSQLGRNLSLALGSSEVTPLEMCSSYGVFANDGVYAEPTYITRITKESRNNKDDSLIERNEPKLTKVLSEETAAIMNDIFRGVVTSGTARRGVRGVRDAHGKTGTTSNDRDAWFVGYTPALVTAVWVGNDDNTRMRSVYGGGVCAPIWSKFMQKAINIHKAEEDASNKENKLAAETKSSESTNKVVPSDSKYYKNGNVNVKICAESGLVATSNCIDTYTVSYEADTQPTERCTLRHGKSSDDGIEINNNTERIINQRSSSELDGRIAQVEKGQYVTVTICADSGKIANDYCPETVSRRYREDEQPKQVCRIHRMPD